MPEQRDQRRLAFRPIILSLLSAPACSAMASADVSKGARRMARGDRVPRTTRPHDDGRQGVAWLTEVSIDGFGVAQAHLPSTISVDRIVAIAGVNVGAVALRQTRKLIADLLGL